MAAPPRRIWKIDLMYPVHCVASAYVIVMSPYFTLRFGFGKYRSHLVFPASSSSVAMTITRTSLSHTMRQKFGIVAGSGLHDL